MAIYVNVLHGARGLFAASRSVERSEWAAYIRAQDIEKRYPGFLAFEFIERVSEKSRPRFEKKIREDTAMSPIGYPAFRIHPEGRREEYFVVNYIEPFQDNERIFGFDIGSEPIRRQALEWARDTGGPALTKKIELLQATGGERSGFLILTPVYRRAFDLENLEDRRQALLGFVSAVVRAANFFRDILGRYTLKPGIRVRVFDGRDPETRKLLYDTASQGRKSGRPGNIPVRFQAGSALVMPGATFYLDFQATEDFGLENNQEKQLPALLLAGTSALSFLFCLMIYFLSTSRQRALKLAEKMTRHLKDEIEERGRAEKELRLSEKRLQALVDNAPAVIYWKDGEGRYVLINRRYEKLFGVTRRAVTGKTDFDIFEKKIAEQFCKNDARVLETRTAEEYEEVVGQDDGPHTYISVKFPLFGADAEPLGVCGISTDITERKSMEETLRRTIAELDASGRKLEEANQKLLELDHLKTNFMRAASHELRTPLTSIKGYVALMLRASDAEIAPKHKEFLATVKKATDRLHRLVNDLLDLSKIEAGRERLNKTWNQPRDWLTEEFELFKAQAAQKNIEMDFEIKDALSKIHCDADQLKQAVGNLLSNAVKYTPTKGRVKLSAVIEEGRLRIDVIDSGIGIREEDRTRIFEPFCSIQHPGLEVQESTGLGLSLVRAITEAHGGTVTFTSRLHQGACFTILLPLDTETSPVS